MLEWKYFCLFSRLLFKSISKGSASHSSYSILNAHKQNLLSSDPLLKSSVCLRPCESRVVSVQTKGVGAFWVDQYSALIRQINENGLESLEDKYIPVKRKKQRAVGNSPTHFIDFCRVQTTGGDGGDGCINFQQVFMDARAGPGGGDGGNGGHVLFRANCNQKSLNHVSSILMAKCGEDGKSKDCHGKSAPDIVIEVPEGTLFRYNGEVIADLEKEGDVFVAARGGAGGKGNSFFATSTNQAPRVAECGGKGESFSYDVELRIMADIGLIGFPNVGKSTLLRSVSRARPKVASYPFTTLNPHVGMVAFADHQQMAVADIPGLVEGSHSNLGLGLGFLKHIQRCSCLLFVLDASQENPLEQLHVLRKELEYYEEGLSQRPHAIVLNKMDLSEARENLPSVKRGLDLPSIPISAKLGHNLVPLLAVMRLLSEQFRKCEQM